MAIVVLGANGFTGQLIVAELCRRQHRPVLAGRNTAALAQLADAHGLGPSDIITVDVTSPDLATQFSGTDVIINTVGPFVVYGAAVADAAITAGADVIDISGEQSHLVRLIEQHDSQASVAGVTMVPAAGFDFAPGDLLAAVCAASLPHVSDIDICYAVSTAGSPRRLIRGVPLSSHGTRSSIAAMLNQPQFAYIDGALTEEAVGQARRLAWFPRPLGPRHAAGIPGGEAVLVPRYLPSAVNVRTYLAMPTWRAELVQAAGALARGGHVGKWIKRRLTRNPSDPTPQVRAATKWATVCEARHHQTVVRCWAWGTDPYGFTAVAAAVAAERLIERRHAGRAIPGVRSIAELDDPQATLDLLAVRSDLRWGSATATLPG